MELPQHSVMMLYVDGPTAGADNGLPLFLIALMASQIGRLGSVSSVMLVPRAESVTFMAWFCPKLRICAKILLAISTVSQSFLERGGTIRNKLQTWWQMHTREAMSCNFVYHYFVPVAPLTEGAEKDDTAYVSGLVFSGAPETKSHTFRC